MQAIKAIYDGVSFTPKQPIPVQGHYEVVITFIEPIVDMQEDTPKREIKLGFLKDIIPPLPESFFDPLPDEELQLWGL